MPLSRRGFVRLSVPVPGTFRIQKRSGTPVCGETRELEKRSELSAGTFCRMMKHSERSGTPEEKGDSGVPRTFTAQLRGNMYEYHSPETVVAATHVT